MNSTKVLRVGLPALFGISVVAAVAAVVYARTLGNHFRQARIPGGTMLVAALDQEVSTDGTAVGDAIELHTVATLPLDDGAVLPQGMLVRGVVTQAKGGGRIAGAPELGLRLTDIEVDGDREPIQAEVFRVHGRNDAVQSAAEIGGGAVAGGIVGRVLGGKGGTLPGAVVGAAIGTGVAVETKGQQLVLRKGQQLRVRLENPVTVTYRPRPERDDSER
jgi:hypothetical protein